MIQKTDDKHDKEVFRSCGIAWSSEENSEQKSVYVCRKQKLMTQKFQVGRILSNKRVIFLKEFKIVWDEHEVKKEFFKLQESKEKKEKTPKTKLGKDDISRWSFA